MNFKKAENIFAAILLLAFFLPWVNIGGLITVSGYNIPNALEGIAGLASAFSKQKESIPLYVYLVYLIPILTSAIFILDFKGISTKILSIVTGILPIVAFIYAIARMGTDLFSGMGLGAYLTLLASVCLILAGVGVIKFNQKEGV